MSILFKCHKWQKGENNCNLFSPPTVLEWWDTSISASGHKKHSHISWSVLLLSKEQNMAFVLVWENCSRTSDKCSLHEKSSVHGWKFLQLEDCCRTISHLWLSTSIRGQTAPEDRDFSAVCTSYLGSSWPSQLPALLLTPPRHGVGTMRRKMRRTFAMLAFVLCGVTSFLVW